MRAAATMHASYARAAEQAHVSDGKKTAADGRRPGKVRSQVEAELEDAHATTWRAIA